MRRVLLLAAGLAFLLPAPPAAAQYVGWDDYRAYPPYPYPYPYVYAYPYPPPPVVVPPPYWRPRVIYVPVPRWSPPSRPHRHAARRAARPRFVAHRRPAPPTLINPLLGPLPSR